MTATLVVRLVINGQNAALLARVGDHGTPARELGSSFMLSPRELAFARELLTTNTQLWLFRCHQRRFCGDFLVLDRSAPSGMPIRCWALELKAMAKLRTGRRGIQLGRCEDGCSEVATTLGVPLCSPLPVIGDPRDVLRLLRGRANS